MDATRIDALVSTCKAADAQRGRVRSRQTNIIVIFAALNPLDDLPANARFEVTAAVCSTQAAGKQ